MIRAGLGKGVAYNHYGLYYGDGSCYGYGTGFGIGLNANLNVYNNSFVRGRGQGYGYGYGYSHDNYGLWGKTYIRCSDDVWRKL